MPAPCTLQVSPERVPLEGLTGRVPGSLSYTWMQAKDGSWYYHFRNLVTLANLEVQVLAPGEAGLKHAIRMRAALQTAHSAVRLLVHAP